MVYCLVGSNVPLHTLQVISGTTLQVRCPNEQCHSTEEQWLVNQIKGQSHQVQLTKRWSKERNKQILINIPSMAPLRLKIHVWYGIVGLNVPLNT